MTIAQMKALLAQASEAAAAAYDNACPTPMIVGTPKNLMGSLLGGDDGGFDTSKPIYHVSDGACGFASVILKPANSRFANFLRKEGIGSTSYTGGLRCSISRISGRSGQSYERNSAAASAAAAIFREAGINAWAESRLD